MKFDSKMRSLFLLSFLAVFAAFRAEDTGVESDELKVEEDTGADDQKLIYDEIEYKTPQLDANMYFVYEPFDDETKFNERWVKSQSTKAGSDEYKYNGEWALHESNKRLKGKLVSNSETRDRSLVMESKARHHAIGTKLLRNFDFNGQNLVVQYEVQFKNGQECGGAYLKLLSAPSGNLNSLNDKTPYSIMFGPDKCGNEHKLHFIFMHKNPLNGTLREIHWNKMNSVNKLDEVVKDGKWHIFRLVVRPDNSFEIQMDKKVVGKGSLLEDFSPPVNPPKEIDDPDDRKPEDWDEREKVPDPEAVKPEDWDENEPRKISDPKATKPSDWLEDEPENIPDPDAVKPADWDPDMDGEWEPPLISNPKCAKVSGCGPWKAPLIDNPKYKGKWKPPLIDNPNYKGKWAPRKIPNPDFFDDPNPYKMLPIDALAFELWIISSDVAFDNILITNSVDVANSVLDNTYQLKKDLIDAESDNWLLKTVKYTNKHPWLWVVYLILLAIPLILFIGYCCVTPGKGSRDIGHEKKYDTPAEDDSARFGISGDEPSPINREELSKESSDGNV
ncbi:calnexin-like protein [Dinothrombium tinctorium]|uniref:Calnexin-like protein n=1 Tax=Dinothrombium tinctorium TaxID=1965070 RepID=A0A3S3P355_9ACAR|nr:calnexin-like protein [Dinothrombium tinctorium]